MINQNGGFYVKTDKRMFNYLTHLSGEISNTACGVIGLNMLGVDKDIIEFGFNLDVNQKIDFNQQKLILRNILKNRLNSRDIEKLIKKGNVKIPKNKVKSIDIINLEKELTEITGLVINIDFNSLKKIGTIKLECKNLEEFNFIIEKFKN